MNVTREYVVQLLNYYHQRVCQIALLRYELEHPVQVSPAEMIDAMSFVKDTNIRRYLGHISNKTLFIACNYQRQTQNINLEAQKRITACLNTLEHEQARLIYYVSLLEKRQIEIIHLLYFECKSPEQISKQLEVSVRTVQAIKSNAITMLTDMYTFAIDLNS